MAIITRRTFGTVSSPGRQVIRRRVFAPREEVPQNRPFNIPAETILQEPAQRLLKGDIRPLFHPIPVTPKGESIGEVSRKVFGIPETPPSPGLQETLEFGSPYSIAELAGRYPPSALKEAARTFGVGALTDIPDIETTPINYILPYGISKTFGARLGRTTLGEIARKAPLGRKFFDYAGRLLRGDPLPRPSLGPLFRRSPEARLKAIQLRQAPPGRPIAMLEPPGGLPKRIVPQPLTMTPGEIQPIVIPTQKSLFETIPEPGKFHEFPERQVKPVLPAVTRKLATPEENVLIHAFIPKGFASELNLIFRGKLRISSAQIKSLFPEYTTEITKVPPDPIFRPKDAQTFRVQFTTKEGRFVPAPAEVLKKLGLSKELLARRKDFSPLPPDVPFLPEVPGEPAPSPEYKPVALPRKKIQYDIDKAVSRGDLATLVKAYGGFRFPKTLHEQGELGKGEQFRKNMGKLRPFLRKDAQSLDELLQELKSQHPDLFGSFDRDSDLLDAIKRGELKPRIPNTEELLAELAETKRELRLQRRSIPEEFERGTGKIFLPFPPAGKSIPLPGPVSLPSSVTLPQRERYVLNEPLEIPLESGTREMARGIREQFSGIKNRQIVRGTNFSNQIKRIIPDLRERQGMFWYKAARGDLSRIQEALLDPKFSDYKEGLQSALNLSMNSKNILSEVEKYYSQAGQVSKELQTIGNVLENYQNRIYSPEPPQEFIKTELRKGIKKTTYHAKHRIFETEFDAVKFGKKFATTDIADALSIHNEEMARVNTSRKLADAMAEGGIAVWGDQRKGPPGWIKVESQSFGNNVLYAPPGIAKGLKAIADPDYTKKIDILRGLNQYQGIVKTVDLSFSFFHHFSMAMQTVYQGDIRALMQLPVMEKILSDPQFMELEEDFARHTGITSTVQENQDILRNLVQRNTDIFSKVTNLPWVRDILGLAERSTEFLFGKIQRFLKVTDYGRKISNWAASHPAASNEEVKKTKIGFAKEINAVYGGLNWEAMGIDKSTLSLLRLGLLAPDWTISNITLFKYALGLTSGTPSSGSLSRNHILTAIVSALVLTEGLNKILTGHSTKENPKGHELEAEIAPNVYVSFLRGGIGDINKFLSMNLESGLPGTFRFIQGKMAPIPRTAVGLLSNVDYSGRRISTKKQGPVKNTFESLKFLLTSAGPIPFGISSLERASQEKEKTLLGELGIASGIARYSKPRKEKKVINKESGTLYSEEALKKLYAQYYRP